VTAIPGFQPGARPLRIAIATSGRFHVLDLARELAAQGQEVTLYSMLPHARAESFGLARRNHRSTLAAVAPVVAWQRFAPGLAPGALSFLEVRAHDVAVKAMLGPCDVFVCMSGIFVAAAKYAQARYGAKVWLERGSRHILSQAEILAKVPGARVPTADRVRRELAGYALADRIVVPSCHVVESFSGDEDASRKLFVNPYGTNLEMFPARAERTGSTGGELRLIYAGTWSLRKGCDVLVQAVRDCTGVRLDHFGRIGDDAFPNGDERFIHHGPVPQAELARHYGAADALVLASREEGLSTVQAQALATGLPVICTDRTGGEDLGHTPALKARITVVPHDDAAALRGAIEALRARLNRGEALPPLTEADRETLSWAAYAKRYSVELARSFSA